MIKLVNQSAHGSFSQCLPFLFALCIMWSLNGLWAAHGHLRLKLTNSSSIKSDFYSLPWRVAVILHLSTGACYPVWLLSKVMLPLRKYKLKLRIICCESDKLSEGWWGKSSAEDREGRTARGKIEPLVLLCKHHSMCQNLTNYVCSSPLCSIRCKYWNKHNINIININEPEKYMCFAGFCAMRNWIENAF